MYRFDAQCLFYNNHPVSATIPDGEHPPQYDISRATGSKISDGNLLPSVMPMA